MAPLPEDLVCTTCGATVRADAHADPDADADAGSPGGNAAAADPVAVARLTWTRGTDRGNVVWTCDRCSRAHLRSIEAKLDQTWW
jgi:hypothetical protein